MNMIVKIKKLTNTAWVPLKATNGSAGFDLYADTIGESAPIHPGETKLIGTGIAMEIPEGYFGAIYARSGLATKKGLRPANCVGIIDRDYRGEICIALHNDSSSPKTIGAHERVAQLVIQPYAAEAKLIVDDDLSDTERGEGGFGSTGV